MSVIALDTSSRRRIVCVLATRDGRLLRGRVHEPAQADTGLPPLLAELIDDDLEALVVVTGPGSYTGVRSGIAAGLGVSRSRGLPLHGIGSLDVLAATLPEAAWVALDAGRGGVYAASCRVDRGVTTCAAPQRMSLSELADRAREMRVVSADPLEVEGLVRVDPVEALTAALPLALAVPPLSPVDVSAVFVA